MCVCVFVCMRVCVCLVTRIFTVGASDCEMFEGETSLIYKSTCETYDNIIFTEGELCSWVPVSI